MPRLVTVLVVMSLVLAQWSIAITSNRAPELNSRVVHIDSSHFRQAVLEGADPWLLLFCQGTDCPDLYKAVEAVAAALSGLVRVGFIDTVRNSALAATYGVLGGERLLLFDAAHSLVPNSVDERTPKAIEMSVLAQLPLTHIQWVNDEGLSDFLASSSLPKVLFFTREPVVGRLFRRVSSAFGSLFDFAIISAAAVESPTASILLSYIAPPMTAVSNPPPVVFLPTDSDELLVDTYEGTLSEEGLREWLNGFEAVSGGRGVSDARPSSSSSSSSSSSAPSPPESKKGDKGRKAASPASASKAAFGGVFQGGFLADFVQMAEALLENSKVFMNDLVEGGAEPQRAGEREGEGEEGSEAPAPQVSSRKSAQGTGSRTNGSTTKGQSGAHSKGGKAVDGTGGSGGGKVAGKTTATTGAGGKSAQAVKATTVAATAKGTSSSSSTEDEAFLSVPQIQGRNDMDQHCYKTGRTCVIFVLSLLNIEAGKESSNKIPARDVVYNRDLLQRLTLPRPTLLPMAASLAESQGDQRFAFSWINSETYADFVRTFGVYIGDAPAMIVYDYSARSPFGRYTVYGGTMTVPAVNTFLKSVREESCPWTSLPEPPPGYAQRLKLYPKMREGRSGKPGLNGEFALAITRKR